eukprot:CAMPEP_0198121364 /NCGR_PEP_ID=MMETSP1442-20131203/31886_1 /TAXON_ID= /ORGANISM="Craspedostauros australis, Strain CCMP3328" /LENGTH=84 /DNA_ID=CAMNT_0043780151 /DNA_START=307 /DNA_END=558 /DNA_ORIENTATION=-
MEAMSSNDVAPSSCVCRSTALSTICDVLPATIGSGYSATSGLPSCGFCVLWNRDQNELGVAMLSPPSGFAFAFDLGRRRFMESA